MNITSLPGLISCSEIVQKPKPDYRTQRTADIEIVVYGVEQLGILTVRLEALERELGQQPRQNHGFTQF
jgi:hypothetical protein